MVFLHPEQRARNQEVFHFIAAVIIQPHIPERMIFLLRVQMLIKAGAVKVGKPLVVFREPPRHPVQDHADSLPVQFINQILEIRRHSISGGRRIIGCSLISPEVIFRMLHHRHTFHMGISHLLHIGNQLLRDFSVIRQGSLPAVLCFLHPETAKMQFVNIERRRFRLFFLPLLQPLFIMPHKIPDIPDHGCAVCAALRPEGIGICLQISQPAFYLDLKFITVSLLRLRHKNLKDSAVPEPPHLMHSAVPAVEIADNRNPQGIRRPYRKPAALHSVILRQVGAQFFIQGIMDSRLQFIRIRRADLRQKTIGILHNDLSAVLIRYLILVRADLPIEHHRRKISRLIRHLHRQDLFLLPQQHIHGNRSRHECLKNQICPHSVHAQQPVGIVLLRIYDSFDKPPVH